MISPVSSGSSSPPPPATSKNVTNPPKNNKNDSKSLSANMIGKGMMSGSEGLPQFLRKKVAFREATHSESLKGIVNVAKNNSTAGPSYTSYAIKNNNNNKNVSNNLNNQNDKKKSEKSVTCSRDAKYGFKFGEVDIFPKERLAPFLKWSKIRSIGPGLTNLGNTCFLNSVLQCLFYTTPLAEYLLSRDHSKRCRISKDDFCGLCTMERLMNKVHGGCSDSCFRPVELVMRLKSIGKHFRPGRQEDSHEFLRLFIETMQKASLPLASDNNNLVKIDARSKETTAVHRIFGGHLQSTVTCSSCRHVSRTFDQFLDLSLDVNKADSVSGAMKTFTTPELLSKSNRYKCEACHRLVEAHKQFTIYKTPEILTLQLKRFSVNPFTGQTSKLNKTVNFPESLDISEWIGDKKESGEGSKYKLYGVIVHEGHSCNSGHYHAFVKNSTGTWYSMNDSSVHQVSLDTVLRQRAYILFYQKQEEEAISGNIKQREIEEDDEVDVVNVSAAAGSEKSVKRKRSKEEKMEFLKEASRLLYGSDTKKCNYTTSGNNIVSANDTNITINHDTNITTNHDTNRTTHHDTNITTNHDNNIAINHDTNITIDEVPQLFSINQLRSSSMWHMSPFLGNQNNLQHSQSKRIKSNFQNSWKVTRIQ